MGFTLKEFTADTNCASQIAGNSAQFAVGIRSRDEACSFDAEDFVTTAADLHLQADCVNVTAKQMLIIIPQQMCVNNRRQCV